MANFLSLPEEMQVAVLEHCSDRTLARLCRTSRSMYDKALPVLWRDIDLQDNDRSLVRRLHFLRSCHNRARENPADCTRLTSLVRSITVGGVPGIWLPADETEYWDITVRSPERPGPPHDIYDILALFSNLQKLSLYVQEGWFSGPLNADSFEKSLSNLDDLTIGGQVEAELLRALLASPEMIKRLSLVNLMEECGQSAGPKAVLFLAPIAHRFTQLTYLHLSKIGALRDLPDQTYGWEWDEDHERSLLNEWAAVLETAHGTLQVLTVRNCYFDQYCGGQSPELEPTKDIEKHLWDYGVGSSDRCREILFPAIARHEWPALRQVTLGGIRVEDCDDSVPNPFDIMTEQIKLEVLPGEFLRSEKDATPHIIYPPREGDDYFSL